MFRRALLARPSGLLRQGLSGLRRMRERARGRRALTELDERMLRDIGLRREDALREADKPFWRD